MLRMGLAKSKKTILLKIKCFSCVFLGQKVRTAEGKIQIWKKFKNENILCSEENKIKGLMIKKRNRGGTETEIRECLGSLFKGISTFVGYLIPKPLSKNKSSRSWEYKGDLLYCSKVYVIARLQFELAY